MNDAGFTGPDGDLVEESDLVQYGLSDSTLGLRVTADENDDQFALVVFDEGSTLSFSAFPEAVLADPLEHGLPSQPDDVKHLRFVSDALSKHGVEHSGIGWHSFVRFPV